jgi:hypothetical protein
MPQDGTSAHRRRKVLQPLRLVLGGGEKLRDLEKITARGGAADVQCSRHQVLQPTLRVDTTEKLA